jgi:hypothetical protein
MTQRSEKYRTESVPKNPLLSQMIVSAVALGIIGLGTWTMVNENSPYHPEIYPEDVTRGGTGGLGAIIQQD